MDTSTACFARGRDDSRKLASPITASSLPAAPSGYGLWKSKWRAPPRPNNDLHAIDATPLDGVAVSGLTARRSQHSRVTCTRHTG